MMHLTKLGVVLLKYNHVKEFLNDVDDRKEEVNMNMIKKRIWSLQFPYSIYSYISAGTYKPVHNDQFS